MLLLTFSQTHPTKSLIKPKLFLRQGVLKSRSASNVPELEAVEVKYFIEIYTSTAFYFFPQKVPDSLKSMIEGLRKMEEEGDDEIDLARPRSGGREPREEFPRPLSQVKPSLNTHLLLFF